MKQKVNKKEILKTLRAYSMVIVLVAIAVLFHFLTEGLIFTPMNLTNRAQTAVIFQRFDTEFLWPI